MAARSASERVSLRAIIGPPGEPAGVVGVMRDVLEHAEREQEIRASAGWRNDMGQDHATMSPSGVTPCSPNGGGGRVGGASGEHSLDRILTTIERREIVAALQRANGQRTLAARMLGISRSRLYRRMEALDIDPRRVDAGEGD